ncbi:hypothetical protein Psyc_0456 [Psychrobacter arcticus 273-4]|uniref:Uncharacterized protein n=1 Tax=Psychrobacter arcticus (strain DSM 17307 / VKM B-2377 / 273-4) TaxID=259536 RepID=Q4FUI9_PSYA2|nr:hypothetical protein [Psychrobacter arcticus]AAZ18319.1 hypothetical protein Psyc_0456 [Psychrobacter arcticus 273-4]
MAKENIVDSFYRLNMDLIGDGLTFTKIPLLQECAPPKAEKTSDTITATDDQEEVTVVVDFKKNSQIDFEVVYDPTDPTHMALDAMWATNGYKDFEYEFVKLARKKTFTAQLMKWEESTDKEKKLRMKGSLTISNLITTTV